MAFAPPVGPQYPGTNPLSIGSVQFSTLECPSHLPIGQSEQKIGVAELIGGGRVVHVFGAQPKPLTFSGRFLNLGANKNIESRVALLRAYNVAGTAQRISWMNESYYGIIRAFDPDYQNANYCDYAITIEITRDANGAFSRTSPTSVDSQVAAINNDAANAYGSLLAADPTTQAWQPAWSNVQASLQQGAPLSQASQSTATNITNQITALTSQVQPYLAALAVTDPKIVPATQFLNALTLISRNVVGGKAPRTVQVSGGSLSRIAAQYYGDASLGVAIAQANGLPSTRIPDGVTKTIILPPFPVAV